MSDLSLSDAQTIVSQTLAYARANGINPLGVAVLDARGALRAYAAEDGSSLGRAHVAIGGRGSCDSCARHHATHADGGG